MRSDCEIFGSGKSYGVMHIAGKQWRAHRLAFFEHYGYLPPVVMHTCDTPACINIDHLRGGTQQDNMDDMVAKGRHWNQKTHCKRGHSLDDAMSQPGGRRCRPCYIAYEEARKAARG